MNTMMPLHRTTRRVAFATVSALALAILAACSGGHAEEAGAGDEDASAAGSPRRGWWQRTFGA